MKQYIKEKYAKPGNVFIGLPHRLDRPVSGVVVFAKTSKALERLNKMFHDGNVKKIYWAITKGKPMVAEGEISTWILRNEKMNKSFSYPKEVNGSKHALLYYRHIAASQNYNLIEVELKTGRHHQIRCQLASIGCPIKGDLKYGAQRSNPDGSISLHARYIEFTHPVSKELIQVTAPLPADRLWQSFGK
jgi:23S rRNA pseudouridine1911/1915/1917 synthase